MGFTNLINQHSPNGVERLVGNADLRSLPIFVFFYATITPLGLWVEQETRPTGALLLCCDSIINPTTLQGVSETTILTVSPHDG